jgi:hypothetical protein
MSSKYAAQVAATAKCVTTGDACALCAKECDKIAA